MHNTMIAFKDPRAIDEFPLVSDGLRDVVFFIRERWPDRYMEITRIAEPLDKARPGRDETGVHLRVHFGYDDRHGAVDVRTNDLTPAQGQDLVDAVNAEFSYNHPVLSLPVASQHGDDNDRHLHLQWRSESVRLR